MSREIYKDRESYMKALRHELRKLPKDDLETAMSYFEEYFEEAGPENEAAAIEDLGTPRQAASQLIVDLAVKNTRETGGDVKKDFRSVWIGILAVFAAPIALPLALAAVVVIASLGLSVLMVLGSVILCGACALVAGAAAVAAGIFYVFRFPADALANIGVGLMSLGLGALITPAMLELTKTFLRGIAKLFGHMVQRFSKGGDSYEA